MPKYTDEQKAIINQKIAESKKRRKKEIKKIEKGEKVNIYDFSYYLKHNQTPMEISLWVHFLTKRPEHFERQVVLEDKFVVDFCLKKLKLIIEIDGISHDGKYFYDIGRENFLIEKGYNIVRFTEEELRKNLNGVALVISHVVKFLTVLNNHNRLVYANGRKFTCSPWIYGVSEELKEFSLEEQKAPKHCFEEF